MHTLCYPFLQTYVRLSLSDLHDFSLRDLHTTLFQIEGGGLVQGASKLITYFVNFCDLKKKMPIHLTKNGVELSYLGYIFCCQKKVEKTQTA